jgi:heat shock protein HslJ
LADPSLTIGFEDGRVGGTSGCNSYGGSYKAEGNSIVISGLVSTLMACVEPVNSQEVEFLRARSEAASYEVVGGHLTLKNASGATSLDFAPG